MFVPELKLLILIPRWFLLKSPALAAEADPSTQTRRRRVRRSEASWPAMESTVVSVGKSVLGGAVSYARSAIAEDGALKLGVQRDQSFIRDELEMMQSFLLAADKEHNGHHHEVIRTWVKQVRDVAYDVEDCLQDYAARLKKPPWWSLPCTVRRERRRIGNEMKELRAKVEDVSQRNMRYHLHGGSEAALQPSSSVTAAELLQSTATMDDIDEARRAAKQREKVDLGELITNHGQGGLRVIAVWETRSGPAGTVPVVRAAYQKLKGEFECHAWVRLMHSFDANEFTGSLVRQFKANSHEGNGKTPQGTPSGVSVLNEMEAQDYNLLHDFTEYVTNKKYLVVLNGLSTIEEWDWIKTYLPNNHNGSRILVYTQQAEVASCFTDDQYKVSEIQHEGSFAKPLYVFYKEDCLPKQIHTAESGSKATTSTTGSTEDRNDTTPSWSLQSVLEEPEPMEWKEPKSELIELISKGGKVISVWGMRDDDKKSIALVKNVYESLGNRFQKCAWFSMKPQFSNEKFLKSLVAQLHQDYHDDTESIADRNLQDDAQDSTTKMGPTESTRRLLANIMWKYKCLFVFDDISSNIEWDSIMKDLPNESNPANQIIVTTREFSVAVHCSGEKKYTYKLEVQNDENMVDSQSQSVDLDPTKMKSETKSSMEGASTTSDSKTVHFDDVIQEIKSSSPSLLNRDSVSAKELARSRTQLIGRGKEKDDVIKLLSDCNPNHQVISVCGMGGIGKTTLVKSIYQSSELEMLKFDRRAWVTVSHPFKLTELLRSLVQNLDEDSPRKKGESKLGIAKNDLSKMEQKELSDKLFQDLEGKKYLIALDDLLYPVEWDSIIRNLPINNNGSRIILTTRLRHVALHCSEKEMYMHNIEGLTDGDALELFLTKVRMDGDESELKPDMMKEAKIIIKKCGRLPLAVATVGGFLSARPRNIIEWRKFSDHISEELDNNPSLEKIKKILTSSYDGLTYHLKSCFLYLSIFPEDHDIRYRRLLRRWTAEGYSRATRNRSNEKEAEEQFTALLNKSMIQQSKTIASGKTGFCQVHDLMREIIISKSEEENLVLVLDDHVTSHSKDKVRHLVVSQSWSREKKNDMQNIVDVSHIRSLTVFGEWKSYFLSKKMRMLRVLDLEDADGLRDTDLVPIGKLRHLKYLSLRGSEGIFNLPSSFGNLLNLETLDIRGTWVTKLPATIGRLQNLKYLHAGMPSDYEYDTRSCGRDIIILLRNFRSIREEMGIRFAVSFIMLLITAWLRNLDLFSVEVPRGIGRLRAIRTLSIVNIARGKALLKNLKKLTQLRKLGVSGINKNNCEELCSAIAGHDRLQSLLLRAEGKVGLQGCLDNMSHPPEDLESLQLYGNLVTLPEWVKKLENLQKLCLRNTNLKADATMEVLRNLPMLTILRLQDNACEEDELCFRPEPFKGLTALELISWDSLKSVTFEGGATPKLEVLLVDHCWNIDKGGFPGIENLATLKEVSLWGYNYDQTYTEFKEQLQKQLVMNKNKPNLKLPLVL